MANTAPTPKAVALVLLPALVLMLTFAFFYVGAFHDPTPHNVPLAVVGPPAVVKQLDALPGDPLDARAASSREEALSQIDDRKVYGAYEAATNRLFVASAANRATAVEFRVVCGKRECFPRIASKVCGVCFAHHANQKVPEQLHRPPKVARQSRVRRLTGI